MESGPILAFLKKPRFGKRGILHGFQGPGYQILKRKGGTDFVPEVNTNGFQAGSTRRNTALLQGGDKKHRNE